MDPQPLFSIIIAAYNYGRFLEQALDSALDQRLTAGSFEVIVVDDGSTDDTPAKLIRYQGKARVIRQENQGQVAAYQSGIQVAQGRYFALLDADDYFYPDKLSAVLEEFQKRPYPGVVYNRFDRVSESGEVIDRDLPRRIRRGRLADLTRYGVVTGAPTSGITADGSLLKHYPPPAGAWRTGLDHFYLHILPLLTRVGFVAEAMHAYRQHGDSQFTSQDRTMQRDLSQERQRLVWSYAREVLNAPFWGEVGAACEDRQSGLMSERLRAAIQAATWLWRDRAPVSLRAWSLAKLTARCTLSPDLYRRMQSILHHLRV